MTEVSPILMFVARTVSGRVERSRVVIRVKPSNAEAAILDIRQSAKERDCSALKPTNEEATNVVIF